MTLITSGLGVACQVDKSGKQISLRTRKNDCTPYLFLGPNVQPVIGQYRAALVARQHRDGEERPEGAHVAEVVPVDGPAHAAGRRLLLLDEFRSLGVAVVRLISW